jgi:endonuclease/exonuclease/phosphatase family metal-dependent hydrolase
LYARLKDRRNGQELIVILNHLARGNAEFRAQQAGGLREWARTKSEPIIAIGDYNFDYDFHTKKGNAGFDAFLADGVWKWIQPKPMIDSNWSDDGNGNDHYPDSLLDFNFVAGAAKDWHALCRVIIREGDFPDDDKTSDHRPVELVLFNGKELDRFKNGAQ